MLSVKMRSTVVCVPRGTLSHCGGDNSMTGTEVLMIYFQILPRAHALFTSISKKFTSYFGKHFLRGNGTL